MSILINLLPDTRQAKLRAVRRRQLATGVAVAIWIVCGGAVVLLSLSVASQKYLISTLSNDISKKQGQLQGMDGLTDALTAQQHLDSLASLDEKRVYVTKFLDAYGEANPKDITLSSMAVDGSRVLTVSGLAKSYAAVGKLARALEAEHVTVGKDSSKSNDPYFTNVTIQSSARTNNAVSFNISAQMGTGVTSGN